MKQRTAIKRPEPITDAQLADAATSLVVRGLRPPEILERDERTRLSGRNPHD